MTQIKDFILEQINKEWSKNNRPCLLSSLGFEIKSAGLLNQLNGQSIKNWLMDHLDDLNIKIIQSNAHREKIGVTSIGNDYDYDLIENLNHKEVNNIENRSLKRLKLSNKDIIDNFIRLTNQLSDDDLKLINIPFHILVKMYKV